MHKTVSAARKTILNIKNLTMKFGGIRALNKLDLQIEAGKITALIGPNGAGKTTLFNCVTGIYNPTAGDILLNTHEGHSRRLNGLKPNEVTNQGLARTFQNIRLFPNMTVLENVMIGHHCRTKAGILGAIFRDRKTRREEEKTVTISYNILKQVGLADCINEFAKNLAYGAQRRLEIARALASEPVLLLLDEPAAGMNPQETLELNTLIKTICAQGPAVLLIEHDMQLVMSLSDYIFVMDYGKKIAAGTPVEIGNNPDVIKAYLGEEAYGA